MSWQTPPDAFPSFEPEGIIVTEENKHAALLDILEKGDPVATAMGRAIASGWPESMNDWFKAEVDRVGPSHAIQALVGMQISLFASIVGGALPAFLHEPLAALYESRVKQRLRANIAAVHKAAQSSNEGGRP